MTRTRFLVAGFILILATASAAGRPAYPFAVAPERACEKLAALETGSGKKFELTRDEVRLFGDARDGTLDTVSFAEACLIASGVTDREKRRAYLEKISDIETAARKAMVGATTTRDTAERLLKFLHEGPMAKGYETEQTDLHVLLDTGKFNCVSSAVLYNVIGRRLGLDLRAVEIPEHVFSVLCDGDRRIDIETTNALGFDPDGISKSKKVRHAGQRREVGEVGLAAVAAYNHGVSLSREKRYHEGALANFRALALDSLSPSAAHNALADLVNWPLELAKAGDYEAALAVLAVALELAPGESALKNNHKVVWSEYAESRMAASKTDEAIAILRRAAKAKTGEDFETRQAYLFAQPAEARIQAGEWEAALKIIDSGIKAVDPKAQKKLREMRVGLFLGWSHDEATKERFEKALAVLKRAAAEESDSRIKNNTVVVYDSWADTHMKRGEWAEAIKIYEQGLKHLPGDGHLRNNLEYCREQMKK
jgi:tetratricopeptide (TPR) repeat protein